MLEILQADCLVYLYNKNDDRGYIYKRMLRIDSRLSMKNTTRLFNMDVKNLGFILTEIRIRLVSELPYTVRADRLTWLPTNRARVMSL